MAKGDIPKNLYPQLRVDHIQNPNRLYAVPLLGIAIKIVMCFPIFIELIFLGIASLFLMIINSFIVLLTGNYWQTAYDFFLGLLRLNTKLLLFFFGLTNTYPGFGFEIKDKTISFDMDMPKTPNRFFAIPLLGGIARIVLLIPYFIYVSVMQHASGIGAVASSFLVLFMGKYPESTYEIERDFVRLNQATAAYMVGLSDSYPSFWISMNHQTVKIILIILGALFMLGNNMSNVFSPHKNFSDQNIILPTSMQPQNSSGSSY